MSAKPGFKLPTKPIGGISASMFGKSHTNPFASSADNSDSSGSKRGGIESAGEDTKITPNVPPMLGKPRSAPFAKTASSSTGSVFGTDGDDDEADGVYGEEDPRSHIARVNAQLQEAAKRQKIEVQQIKAVMEDETVYEYDTVLDQLHSQRMQTQKEADDKRKQENVATSKYLDVLKESAELRKRERQLLVEKHRLRALEQEDAQYGDKERFVTSAYKKKLEEDKKWDEKLREQDERDAAGMKMGVDKIRYQAMLGAAGLTTSSSESKTASQALQNEKSTTLSKDRAEPSQSTAPQSDIIAGPALPPTESAAEAEGGEAKPPENTRAAKIEAARQRYFARKQLREQQKRS